MHRHAQSRAAPTLRAKANLCFQVLPTLKANWGILVEGSERQFDGMVAREGSIACNGFGSTN